MNATATNSARRVAWLLPVLVLGLAAGPSAARTCDPLVDPIFLAESRASNVATVTVDFKAAAEVITPINIDVNLKRNGRRDITVSGTTTEWKANSMTVEILNTTGQYELVGSSNVDSTTGAWSVTARNSQIVPA